MSSDVQYSSVDASTVEDQDGDSGTSNAAKKQVAMGPILKPTAILLVGGLLALGHHLFNSYADNKPLDFKHAPPQVWMNRIGIAFAFGFRASLSTTLSFVLCQLMWLTLRRKFLTFSEIDTAYLTANRDVMATFFSSSILRSPTLVLTVAVSFLLSIPTVFTPSSLQVVSGPLHDLSRPCQVPTGNLTNGSPGSTMYQTGGWGYFTGVTPVAQKLVSSTFTGQKIPSLPQPCGLNCTYSVSVPSIAFQCKAGVELPAGMSGTLGMVWQESFWNATTNSTWDPSPPTSFYVYWKSTTTSGTNGSALCTIGTAKYDFTIRTLNGQQSVSYNITHTGDLLDSQSSEAVNLPRYKLPNLLQLSALATATRSLLLGAVSIQHGASDVIPNFSSSVISAAFFDSTLNTGVDFAWGDVPRGIEQLSHNVSAAILSMNLGVQDSTCIVSKQDIIYQYNRLDLWLPYGVALLIISLCLTLGIIVFLKFNPENLTTSFSDTVNITRNQSLNITAGNGSTDDEEKFRLPRFRLGSLKSGGDGFGMREEMKSV